MDDVATFLSAVVPRLEEEVVALHNGDVAPRMALWSRDEPVTLFGAELTRHGWDEVEPAFEWLATSFTGSQSFHYDVLAAEVSGDLAYVVGIEHSVAARRGAPPTRYALRVTTIFRREGGVWKVVHRHGDSYDEASRNVPADTADRATAATDGAGTDQVVAGS
jgi:ketosteroid isomerase-like protein